MTEDKDFLHVANGGKVTFKRFAGGVGFELEYPIGITEGDRKRINDSFLESMDHMESIVNQLIDLCDDKTGYADQPAKEESRRSSFRR